MSITNIIFFGYDRQLSHKSIDTIANCIGQQEDIYFSPKNIKILVDEKETNVPEEDLVIYTSENEESDSLNLIDLTDKTPEIKHNILENYRNSQQSNIFVCVFKADYILQQQDKKSLKKIYTLFNEDISNSFFCLVDSQSNNEEYLYQSADYVRAEINFIFNKNGVFDFHEYQKRVLFLELEEAFKIYQKNERSPGGESKFENFIAELISCWKEKQEKETPEMEVKSVISNEETQMVEIKDSSYKPIKEKSNTIASILEDVSVLIGKRKDEFIQLKVGGTLEQPGINLIEKAKELADLAQDIRQGIFKLIVLGAFSNGKSTLINTLLGEKALKAKALPTTSIVTMLVQGNSPYVTIKYKDDRTPLNMDFDSFFKEFTLSVEDRKNIEELGYFNRFENIKYAQIERNYRLLANGVRLIDSPGLEDEKSRTDLVLSYLNECQAVILVLNAQQLLTQSEREFIEEELVNSNFNNIFFVVNKINLVDENEVEEVEEYLRQQIQHHFLDSHGDFDADSYQRRVFFVNAQGALEARTSNNNSFSLNESGIPELESELEYFLTSDRKNTAAFEVTFQRLSEAVSNAHDSINQQKQALAKPLQELEANRSKAEKLLKNSENQKEEIEQTVVGYGEQISEKIFSSLLVYLNELKTTWEADSQEFELKGLNFGSILKTTVSKKAKEKIAKIIQEEIEQYFKEKLTQWGKNQVPIIIEEDVEKMMSKVEKQVEDFQFELIQIDNLFATGELLSNHKLDTEKGKVSKTVQGLLNIVMLDFSGLTGTLMGRGNWGSFISRVIIEIFLGSILIVVLGPIWGPIAYVIAEVLHMGMQQAGFKQRLLKSVGEQVHENLPTEMAKQHDKICGKVQEQFKQQSTKLTEHLQAQINDKRTEQEDILNQKRQQSFSVEQEKVRLDTIDRKLTELHNIAGRLVGRSPEE